MRRQRLQHVLISYRVKQADLGRLLGIHRSAVHKKLNGERPWLLGEMQAVLAYLQAHHDATLTLDDLFGSEAA